jgi:hypothetical protein
MLMAKNVPRLRMVRCHAPGSICLRRTNITAVNAPNIPKTAHETRGEVESEKLRPAQHALDDCDLIEAHHVHPEVDGPGVEEHGRHEAPRLAVPSERSEVAAKRDQLQRAGLGKARALDDLEREHCQVCGDEAVGDPWLPAIYRSGGAARERMPRILLRRILRWIGMRGEMRLAQSSTQTISELKRNAPSFSVAVDSPEAAWC